MFDLEACYRNQTGRTPNGGVRSATYFLDECNHLTPSAQAFFQEVHELDEQNRVIQVTVTRIKATD